MYPMINVKSRVADPAGFYPDPDPDPTCGKEFDPHPVFSRRSVPTHFLFRLFGHKIQYNYNLYYQYGQ